MFEFSQSIVGKKYALGGGVEGELDCFLVALKYLQYRKVVKKDFHQWKGIKVTEYAEIFRNHPERAKELMMEFIREHSDEVYPNKAIAGDILLCQLKRSDTQPFLAILSGNAQIIAASDKVGVNVGPLDPYNVLGAFRCHKHSQ